MKKDSKIEKAKSVLDYLANDEETMRLYEVREKAIHDEVTRTQGAKEEGKREGIKEGIKEGVKKTAINMLEKGVDIEFIAEVTGLTKDEINKINR